MPGAAFPPRWFDRSDRAAHGSQEKKRGAHAHRTRPAERRYRCALRKKNVFVSQPTLRCDYMGFIALDCSMLCSSQMLREPLSERSHPALSAEMAPLRRCGKGHLRDVRVLVAVRRRQG